VNHPSPAIVAQAAVRRLPRLALLLFCLAYVLPGFLGRGAWKSEDMTALGYMAALAHDGADWLHPSLLGIAPENPALLPYWIGAWALDLCPSWLAPDLAARLPFMLLLALALLATWSGTYYLARSQNAQPVAFAFGGEAAPKDYARAIADGGLLALIGCLGLAQLAHEATPALVQLAFSSLLFLGLAALPYYPRAALVGALAAILGLSLSGAPALGLLYVLGGALIHALDKTGEPEQRAFGARLPLVLLLLLGALACAALGWSLHLLRWKIEWPHATLKEWNGYAQLLIWFTWPAWPLALWTLWRWRRQWLTRSISRHLALPLWILGVTLFATVTSAASDRTLLLALPALAALAAFALPTLKREMAALVDWFTLLFFSGSALIIWVVWIAMQTGFPSQPASNVERLAPGFEASFSGTALAPALLATLVWAWLVHWRVGRHRAAIWKSLVLPAGGAALCWLLLMTLWIPLLDFSQGYTTLVSSTLRQLNPPGCAQTLGLGRAKIAALQFYGNLQLQPLDGAARCPWLIAEPAADMDAPAGLDPQTWQLLASVRHPTDGNERVLLFRRR